MSGMRQTPRIRRIIDLGLKEMLCHDCFPHAGAGYAYDGPLEYYRVNRNRGWKPAGDNTLPPAGNGHPAPTGKCETCIGIGLVAVPISGVHHE